MPDRPHYDRQVGNAGERENYWSTRRKAGADTAPFIAPRAAALIQIPADSITANGSGAGQRKALANARGLAQVGKRPHLGALSGGGGARRPFWGAGEGP